MKIVFTSVLGEQVIVCGEVCVIIKKETLAMWPCYKVTNWECLVFEPNITAV